MTQPLDLFAVAAPGLAPLLAAEMRDAGFAGIAEEPAGVAFTGGWPEVWRANLALRGATRILVRIAVFRALHLAQLDKRARKVAWSDWLRTDIPFRVEATCRKSRIYHAGAAAQRVEGAVAAGLGAPPSKDAAVVLKVRIDDDLCTISLDSSGASLHRRGLKEEVNKAPMRETLAALFLRACGWDGSEPVCDPMCGSGTFPIEAAEIAAGLLPGRARSFAFEHLATFDSAALAALRHPDAPRDGPVRFHGFDRDAGAIRMSSANAARAGVSSLTRFERRPISEAGAPEGPAGLVIVNPPYGGRIGDRKLLFGLYAAFGERMRTAFPGWRVGLVTADAGLAKATGLHFADPGPVVDHGGTKIRLWQAAPA